MRTSLSYKEEVMALSRGKKSTSKKKEEVVVKSPKKAVEKVESPKKTEPKKAVEKVDPTPVQEELPPTPTPVSETMTNVEPIVEPVIEEVVVQAVKPVIEPVVEEVVVQDVAPAPQTVEIGSLVMMPSGKRGTVIAVNRKGYFEVRSERNPRKTYLYESSQLSLV
jgi:hypothetical protein